MARGIGGAAEGLIGNVVRFVVVLAILGATVGLVFTNIGDVLGVFENNASDLNNSVLTAIAPTLGLLLGVGFVFGLVKLGQRMGRLG